MEKMQARKLIGMVALLIGMAACTTANEEDLIPQPVDTTIAGPTCDTLDVSFAQTIMPILEGGGCINCHAGRFPSGNVDLSDYDNIVLNGERSYGSMAHNAGFSPMPKNLAQLPDCEIKQFRAWLDQGALDN